MVNRKTLDGLVIAVAVQFLVIMALIGMLIWMVPRSETDYRGWIGIAALHIWFSGKFGRVVLSGQTVTRHFASSG